MELLTKSDIQPAVSSNNTALLRRVISLAYYDRIPALKFTMLLNKLPGVQLPDLEKLIEKGILELEINLQNPFLLLNNEADGLFLDKVEWSLYDKAKDQVLYFQTLSGGNRSVRIRATLNAQQTMQCNKALQNIPSAMHIGASLFFNEKGEERKIAFRLPFRALLDNRFFTLPASVKNNCVQVKYFDPQAANYLPAPVFTTSRSRAAKPLMHAAKMVKHKNKLVAASDVIKPSATAAVKPALQPEASFQVKNKLWYLNDIKIWGEAAPASLPLITDQDQWVWADASDTTKFWYMPEYKLEAPAQSVNPFDSPFLLTFKKIGTQPTGEPVLEGEVILTLISNIPQQAKDKINGIAGASLVPVPVTSTTWVLELPFTDAEGKQKISAITPSQQTTANNKTELNFQLTNAWIRACYGVLSIEGFQQTKASIKTYTSFRGLAKAQEKEWKLISGVNFYKLPLAKTNLKSATPVFNIPKRALVYNDEEIIFHDKSKQRGQAAKMTMVNKVLMAPKAVTANIITAKPANIPVKPATDTSLVERSFAREQTTEVFFPCQSFGQSYVEEDTTGALMGIGCREPYRLGEIKFKLYEELKELAATEYKIFRSLQSPGHFMVLPAIYRITRFEKEHAEAAFKPCIHLYGSIDESQDFQNSLCILDMSLEPDIPVDKFYALKKILRTHSSTPPVIEFPGEIMEEVKFEWALPAGMKVNTLSLGRTIQVSLSLDIMEVLLLQAMLKNGSLQGSAVYTLPDQSEYKANLNPGTFNITGPWSSGPLLQDIVNDGIRFTNKTERSIQLSKLSRFTDADVETETIAVNKSLLPGESFTHNTTSTADLFIPACIPEQKEVELDQSWVFVDDVNCQVIFTTSIDFAQAGLTAIDIEMSFADGPPKIFNAQLTSADPVAELESFIPLTKIAGTRNISFRLKTPGVGTGSFTEWQPWSVKDLGNIINITSELLSST